MPAIMTTAILQKAKKKKKKPSITYLFNNCLDLQHNYKENKLAGVTVIMLFFKT